MVQVRGVLLREVSLPPAVVAAINEKMVQYEVSLEYQFRVDREKLEAERKRIEAAGIRDFQLIVGNGLTEPYLRWKGIDATLRLAESPGSRTVIIGGKDGLPLILNQSGTPDIPTGPPRDASLPPSLSPLPNALTLANPPVAPVLPPPTTARSGNGGAVR